MLRVLNIQRAIAFFSGMCFCLVLSAQAPISNFSAGLELKTNGIGITAQADLGDHRNALQHGISLSIASLKHNKESKVQNPNYTNPKPYVFGKVNNVFTIEPLYLFTKSIGLSTPNQPAFKIGVEAGPSLAVTRPYYVFVQDIDNVNNYHPKKTAYDAAAVPNQDDILASAGWNNGFNQLTPHAGVKVRLILVAEWQKSYYLQRFKTFVETSYFPTGIEILNNNQSKVFTSFGASYQIGGHS